VNKTVFTVAFFRATEIRQQSTWQHQGEANYLHEKLLFIYIFVFYKPYYL